MNTNFPVYTKIAEYCKARFDEQTYNEILNIIIRVECEEIEFLREQIRCRQQPSS